MKIATIYHAVHNSPTDSIVFWVDPDVTFRENLPDNVIEWIQSKDVAYIPWYFGGISEQNRINGFETYNMSKTKDVQNALLSGTLAYVHIYVRYFISKLCFRIFSVAAEIWKVESGLFALTVNYKTIAFMSKALGLYRGGMLALAQECYGLSENCKRRRVHNNVFLNDVYVFSLLLHSDAHNDSFFNENLKHGNQNKTYSFTKLSNNF